MMFETGPSMTTLRRLPPDWSRVTPFRPFAHPSIVVLLVTYWVPPTVAEATANWMVRLPWLRQELNDPVPDEALVVTVQTEPPAPPVAFFP
jgi:hypothetical protein